MPTPIYSPWSLDFDYGIPVSNYASMKGVRKPSGKGIVKGKTQGRGVKAKKTVKPGSGNACEDKDDTASGPNPTKLLTKTSEMWVGKGRGQGITVDDDSHENSLNGPPDEKPGGGAGRGQWTGSSAQAPPV